MFSTEPALENPLPWDTIPSAKYDRLDLVAPYLPDLLKRSTERVAAEREYDYVREDIQPELLKELKIHYVRTIEELLDLAFPRRVLRPMPAKEPVQQAI